MYKRSQSLALIVASLIFSGCVVLPSHKYHTLLEDSKTKSLEITRLQAENADLKARMKQAYADLKSLSGLWLGKTSLSRNYPPNPKK